jgi:catechol 2,3-dioxygenase-like lactoylglutathione lyase family enzyme
VRLNHVTLGATDVERSVEFYTRLGLRQIVASYPDYARFVAPDGNATLSLSWVDTVAPPTTTVHFECEDVDATVAEPKARGVAFDMDPTDLGCGARQACGTPTATSSSSTRRARIGWTRRGS